MKLIERFPGENVNYLSLKGGSFLCVCLGLFVKKCTVAQSQIVLDLRHVFGPWRRG